MTKHNRTHSKHSQQHAEALLFVQRGKSMSSALFVLMTPASLEPRALEYRRGAFLKAWQLLSSCLVLSARRILFSTNMHNRHAQDCHTCTAALHRHVTNCLSALTSQDNMYITVSRHLMQPKILASQNFSPQNDKTLTRAGNASLKTEKNY